MRKVQQANHRDMAEIGIKIIKQYMKANKRKTEYTTSIKENANNNGIIFQIF